jgi:hypothetical protein
MGKRDNIMSACIGIALMAGLLRQFALAQRYLVKPAPTTLLNMLLRSEGTRAIKKFATA